MTDTWRPPTFAFVIPQGQHFHLEFPPFVKSDGSGDRYDFTAANPDGASTARLEVRTYDGTLVTAFSTGTVEDGTITLDSQGNVALDLSADHTADLAPVAVSNGALVGKLYGDLVITDPTGEPWLMGKGTGYITQEVTES